MQIQIFHPKLQPDGFCFSSALRISKITDGNDSEVFIQYFSHCTCFKIEGEKKPHLNT